MHPSLIYTAPTTVAASKMLHRLKARFDGLASKFVLSGNSVFYTGEEKTDSLISVFQAYAEGIRVGSLETLENVKAELEFHYKG